MPMMHQLFFSLGGISHKSIVLQEEFARGGKKKQQQKKKRKKEKLQRLPLLSCATLPFHCNKIRWMRAVNSQFHFNSSDCSALTIRRKTKKEKEKKKPKFLHFLGRQIEQKCILPKSWCAVCAAYPSERRRLEPFAHRPVE